MNPNCTDNNNEILYDEASECLEIAMKYQKVKKYTEAERYFTEAIDIFEELVIPSHCCEEYWFGLAASYNALAVMLQDAEDVNGAQTYYLCAIDVMEGRVDENKLEHVPNLAVCYSFLGLLSENEACFRKAYDYAKLFPNNSLCREVIEMWSDVFQ